MSNEEDIGIRLLEVLGPPTATLLADLARRKIASQDEAAQRLLHMAVATGVAIEDLTHYLLAADAARAEVAVRTAQDVVYGPPGGDP